MHLVGGRSPHVGLGLGVVRHIHLVGGRSPHVGLGLVIDEELVCM